MRELVKVGDSRLDAESARIAEIGEAAEAAAKASAALQASVAAPRLQMSVEASEMAMAAAKAAGAEVSPEVLVLITAAKAAQQRRNDALAAMQEAVMAPTLEVDVPAAVAARGTASTPPRGRQINDDLFFAPTLSQK